MAVLFVESSALGALGGGTDARRATAPTQTGGGLAVRSLGLLVLLRALVAAILASLAFGSKPLPVAVVLGAFRDFDGSNDHLIVRELRLPRTFIGLGVGVGLGLAGAGDAGRDP
jgi:iron complex transport system permease protein